MEFPQPELPKQGGYQQPLEARSAPGMPAQPDVMTNQAGIPNLQQPYAPPQGGLADQYQGAVPNQGAMQQQPGPMNPGGMPGPAEGNERGWKGALAGGVGGGYGASQVGGTGSGLLGTLAGAVLGSKAEDKYFKGDDHGQHQDEYRDGHKLQKGHMGGLFGGPGLRQAMRGPKE